METGTRKITFDEYRGINAVNASRLADFARSPAHCWLRMQKPMEPTKQTKLGIALHTALLEPDDFDAAFKPARFDGRTKDGKAEREAALLGGVTLLPEDDYMAVLGMRDSLATHPRVRALMAAATALEDSAVWMRGDRACKARRDVVGPDFLADVKTTSSFERFSPWHVTDLGYYRQAAWYMDGAKHLGHEVRQFFFLVVANSEPYESGVYYLSPDALAAGQRECDRLFGLYLECERSGIWPRHVTELMPADVASSRLAELSGVEP